MHSLITNILSNEDICIFPKASLLMRSVVYSVQTKELGDKWICCRYMSDINVSYCLNKFSSVYTKYTSITLTSFSRGNIVLARLLATQIERSYIHTHIPCSRILKAAAFVRTEESENFVVRTSDDKKERKRENKRPRKFWTFEFRRAHTSAPVDYQWPTEWIAKRYGPDISAPNLQLPALEPRAANKRRSAARSTCV